MKRANVPTEQGQIPGHFSATPITTESVLLHEHFRRWPVDLTAGDHRAISNAGIKIVRSE